MPSAKSLFPTGSSAAGDDVLVIYTDGASRGNPGHASLGVVIGDQAYGEYLGIQTNNYAEYSAIVFALAKAKATLGTARAARTRLDVRMDSELAVKQLNHIYKIKDEALQRLFIAIWNAMLDFKSVTFTHVPREHNKGADAAANRALNERLVR